MIHYLTLADRSMFSEYLGHWGRALAQSGIRILRYENLLHETRFEPGTYIFSTFDEVQPAMRRYIDALAERLREAPGVRVFNDPQRVLTRFALHEELSHLGRNDYRSFRANSDLHSVRFPVFIRSEDAHDGALSPLLHSHAEIDAWIGRAMILGRSLDALLVVEFCDTADAGGWYRKYSAFNVGGRIVPRMLNNGRHWMLKFGGSDFSMQLATEELAYVEGNPHERELREIFEIAGTDYGRIDYSMLDGRVQTWEINLNPTIGRGTRPSRRKIHDEVRETRERSKQTFYANFEAAWRELLATSPANGASFEVHIDPLVLEAAREGERRRWRTRNALVEAGLRVARPMMKTPLAPLLRLLYHGPQRLVRATAAPFFRALGRRARTRSA